MPIAADVCLFAGASILHPELVNLYGWSIGEGTSIGPFVEIQKGVRVGARRKIQSHSFLCDGVTIEDELFIGHGVMFVNDHYPNAAGEWKIEPVVVRRDASAGSGAVIFGGVTIGEDARVGGGAVVTHGVSTGETVGWGSGPAASMTPRVDVVGIMTILYRLSAGTGTCPWLRAR